jgi:hypothetical protein
MFTTRVQGRKATRFCGQLSCLPQRPPHEAAVRRSGLPGFAALSQTVSLDGYVSAIDRMPGSAAWAYAEGALAGYEFVEAEKEPLAARRLRVGGTT